METIYTIERFEEDFAVTVTDGRFVNIPFEDIPENSEVGDKLKFVEA
jgi:hypothetical protein